MLNFFQQYSCTLLCLTNVMKILGFKNTTWNSSLPTSCSNEQLTEEKLENDLLWFLFDVVNNKKRFQIKN